MNEKISNISSKFTTLNQILNEIDEPLCNREEYKEYEDLKICPHFFIKINGILDSIDEKKLKFHKLSRIVFHYADFKDKCFNTKTMIFNNKDCEFHLLNNININDIKTEKDILDLNKQKNRLFLLKKEEQEKVCHILFEFLRINKKLSDKKKEEILSAFISLSSKFLDVINNLSDRNIPPKIIWEEFQNFNINKKRKKYETPESYFYIFEILHQIGFDVIIINTYGVNTIEKFINLMVIELPEKKRLKNKENFLQTFVMVLFLLLYFKLLLNKNFIFYS